LLLRWPTVPLARDARAAKSRDAGASRGEASTISAGHLRSVNPRAPEAALARAHRTNTLTGWTTRCAVYTCGRAIRGRSTAGNFGGRWTGAQPLDQPARAFTRGQVSGDGRLRQELRDLCAVSFRRRRRRRGHRIHAQASLGAVGSSQDQPRRSGRRWPAAALRESAPDVRGTAVGSARGAGSSCAARRTLGTQGWWRSDRSASRGTSSPAQRSAQHNSAKLS
jgi:hypothetical protein